MCEGDLLKIGDLGERKTEEAFGADVCAAKSFAVDSSNVLFQLLLFVVVQLCYSPPPHPTQGQPGCYTTLCLTALQNALHFDHALTLAAVTYSYKTRMIPLAC